jgi:predicted GNAT superfamily acetyltransferase
MLEYRVLHEMHELEQAVSLSIEVWGMNPRNAPPSAILHVMALNGGLVMGAYDGERMVGMQCALVARRGDELSLWSHMTGVHPDYQRSGIGVEMKLRQREWALEHDYKVIRWTYDPIKAGNARFNLYLLGQTAGVLINTYHVNFYGDMDDDINRGMPSDRAEVTWYLDQPSYHVPTEEIPPLLLCADERERPVMCSPLGDGDYYVAQIPAHVDPRLDKPGALAWRLALREVLLSTFERGFAAVDFTRHDGVCLYHLRRLAISGQPSANTQR